MLHLFFKKMFEDLPSEQVPSINKTTHIIILVLLILAILWALIYPAWIAWPILKEGPFDWSIVVPMGIALFIYLGALSWIWVLAKFLIEEIKDKNS